MITDSFVVRFPPLNQQLLDRLYRPEPLPDHPHDDEEGNQDSGSESDGGPDDGPEGGAERMAVPEAEQPLHERDLHIQYPLPVLYYDRNLPHLRPIQLYLTCNLIHLDLTSSLQTKVKSIL